MHNKNELRTWRLAAVVLVLLAAVVFFTQHFVGRLFDIVLEIFIFYIPAFSIVALYFYFRRRPKL